LEASQTLQAAGAPAGRRARHWVELWRRQQQQLEYGTNSNSDSDSYGHAYAYAYAISHSNANADGNYLHGYGWQYCGHRPGVGHPKHLVDELYVNRAVARMSRCYPKNKTGQSGLGFERTYANPEREE
jgi:hypothetical protein